MVLKLIVENDKNELSIFEFNSNLITIGRAESSDLVLNERNISRHHFQMELVDNRIFINDNGSSNFTFVNDREIKQKTEIFIGDIISVGDYNIYLEQSEEGFAKTTQSITFEEEIAEENLLLAKNGPNGGRVFPIKGHETVIGSHAGADIYLYSPGIPEVHSKIIFDGNTYLLIAVNASEKVPLIINGMKLDSVDIRNGDEIAVGEHLFEFVEKGFQYNSYPYLLKAEEERKKRLMEEINQKQIISTEEKEEKTEVTRKVSSQNNSKIMIIAVAVIALIVIIATIIIVVKNKKSESEDDTSFFQQKTQQTLKIENFFYKTGFGESENV